jgi:hypothetical protein
MTLLEALRAERMAAWERLMAGAGCSDADQWERLNWGYMAATRCYHMEADRVAAGRTLGGN